MGLETPYVPWGCHPELIEIGDEVAAERRATSDEQRANGPLRLPRRLPRASQAARAGAGGVRGDRRRRACGWWSRRRSSASRSAPRRRPPSATRGSSCGSPTSRPPSTCARSRAATSASRPARWEGLGLPLYEAIAFGMPAVTNDAPPMNEAIHDGENGLLVASTPNGTAKSGIPALDPDVGELRRRDRAPGGRLPCAPSWPRERLRVRDTERPWTATVEGIGELLETGVERVAWRASWALPSRSTSTASGSRSCAPAGACADAGPSRPRRRSYAG